jgi:hypothetical protein
MLIASNQTVLISGPRHDARGKAGIGIGDIL